MSLQNLSGCLEAAPRPMSATVPELRSTRRPAACRGFARRMALFAAALATCTALAGCGSQQADEKSEPVAQHEHGQHDHHQHDHASHAMSEEAPASSGKPTSASSGANSSKPAQPGHPPATAGDDSHLPPWRRGSRTMPETPGNVAPAEAQGSPYAQPAPYSQANPYSQQAQPSPASPAAPQSSSWPQAPTASLPQPGVQPQQAPANPYSNPAAAGLSSQQSAASQSSNTGAQNGWQGALGDLGRNLLGGNNAPGGAPSGGTPGGGLQADTLINRLLPGAAPQDSPQNATAGQGGGFAPSSLLPRGLAPGNGGHSGLMPSQLAPSSSQPSAGQYSPGQYSAAQPSTSPVPLPATTASQPVDAPGGAATPTDWPQHYDAPLAARSSPQLAERYAPAGSAEMASSAAESATPGDQPTGAPSVPAPPADAAADAAADDGYTKVKVFYGTDRAQLDLQSTTWMDYVAKFYGAAAALLIAGIFYILSGMNYARSLARPVAWFATAGAVLLTAWGGLNAFNLHQAAAKPGVAYGGGRGKLEVGICEVSIPPRHEVGELEAPSIIRLEVREDPTKHVVLMGSYPQEPAEFYEEMRNRVSQSPRKDAFVFVHGFNVSFENAARRTAQMAHDLNFEGAPIFYSWPSQAQLTAYTVDENNVEWTVPHLREFLLDVAQQSGAESICLVAHSMGNRALTKALQGLSYRIEKPIFREVVLTAPDIDADVFRRDLAPRIVRTADRVTLYASSNDEALRVSKQIHGAPRAGDSGALLVVMPGIETIDVSGIDTSLLGHSYYGSNGTVLSDLIGLLKHGMPAAKRSWLLPRDYDGLPYWVFAAAMANADANPAGGSGANR